MFKTFARAKELDEFLAQHVAPCRYIRSLSYSPPGEWNTYDGVHYTPVYYKKWSAAIMKDVLQLSKGDLQTVATTAR